MPARQRSIIQRPGVPALAEMADWIDQTTTSLRRRFSSWSICGCITWLDGETVRRGDKQVRELQDKAQGFWYTIAAIAAGDSQSVPAQQSRGGGTRNESPTHTDTRQAQPGAFRGSIYGRSERARWHCVTGVKCSSVISASARRLLAFRGALACGLRSAGGGRLCVDGASVLHNSIGAGGAPRPRRGADCETVCIGWRISRSPASFVMTGYRT
jgi:hypothetical protein